MASRVEITDAPRIVVSKAGYNASNPDLPNIRKIFDSDWLFGGSIIMAGVYRDDAPYGDTSQLNPGHYTNDQIKTTTSSDIVINFPYTLSYVPAVTLLPLADKYYWNQTTYGKGLVFAPRCDMNHSTTVVTSSGITVKRNVWGSGFWMKFSFLYLVMSF